MRFLPVWGNEGKMINRILSMMTLVRLCFCYLGCDDDDEPEPEPGDAGAPYIYLYPEEAREVSVKLIPEEGAWLIHSDPPYEDGWTVWAEPGGKLDDEYDFLFYSARVLWEFQTERGWAVEAKDIFSWFENTLSTLGFSEDETDDFMDYWTKHLPYSPCYLVYPQDNESVERQVRLIVDPEPDSVLRLWLASSHPEIGFFWDQNVDAGFTPALKPSSDAVLSAGINPAPTCQC
jgi:hypothetical protein